MDGTGIGTGDANEVVTGFVHRLHKYREIPTRFQLPVLQLPCELCRNSKNGLLACVFEQKIR
jgi:hypothetical protein